MLIKDLVKLNTNAEFFNDVQLRWFWDAEKNARLAKGYIFTRQAGENRKSTVDALEMVHYGLIDPGSENRMLFLATFGQGKTHLALAMANFFGKPPESEEVRDLIKSLEHAYGNSPAIKNFTDLKARNPRHLVVCLQGDEVGFDLSSYFVREVERSLKEILSASGGRLPLWFATALELIETAVMPQRAKADAFLAPREMDLPKLQHRLQQSDSSLFDLVRELIEHVTGVPPNLGTRLSLNALVSNICQEYCGPGKPYAGLVVLFDEFNAFMHAYSKRDTAGTPLQDLLNGIANNREKSVFVGFAQRDPMTIVSALQPTNRDALTVEMNRIPQDRRIWLFNNLETVLDAYIGGDDAVLTRVFEEEHAWPALFDAEESTQMLFKRRYDQELQWSPEEFRAKVTVGCFPLHPLATALLCSVDLAETGNNARGLLQFVLASQESVQEEPVVRDDVPTWVYPAQIVDWFKETLCVEPLHWEQYQKAVYDGGGDLPREHQEILKAMLLHLIAKMPMANVKYEHAIALLAGLGQEATTTALKKMSDRNLIDRDAINNKYAFLSASGGDRELRDYVNREVEQAKLKLETLQAPGTIAVTGFRATEVPVEWGNSGDWQVSPTLLTKEFFSAATLKTLLKDNKGIAVWLIPRDETEWAHLDASAKEVIDSTCGGTPCPVAVFLPNSPFPGIHEGLRKLQVIQDLPQQDRVKFGAYLPNNKARITDQLREQMKSLRATPRKWYVHTAIEAALQADNLTDEGLIRRVVIDCFRKAPPSFVQSQKEDNAKLRKASALLGKLLLVNQASELRQQLQVQPNDGNLKMAETIADKILMVGPSAAWGVIGRTYRIQEPAHSRVRLAWDELSNAFPTEGSAGEVSKVLTLLTRPPYGYDSNTLTLLLCAWIGFYRHDLDISKRGAAYPLSRLQEALDAGKPAAFLNELSGEVYAIKRRDRTVALKEVEDILSQVQRITSTPLSKETAGDALIKLEAFLADPGNGDPTLRERVEGAKDRVKSDLGMAESYDAKAGELLTKVGSVRKVVEALNLLERARELPAPSGVQPTQPTVAEIVTTADAALERTVEDTCQRLSSLKSVTDFGRQEDELKGCLKALKEKTHLQHKIVEAIAALKDAKVALEARQSEDATLRMIEALSTQVPITELQGNIGKLNEISAGSQKVVVRRDAKRKELAERIESLTVFVDDLMSRVDAATDSDKLRLIEREIDTKTGFFAGDAVHETKLTAARERCTQLGRFFGALKTIHERPVDTPQDLANLLEESANLRQQFASRLSSGHSALLGEVEARKRSDAEAKADIAKKWLRDLERSWSEDAPPPAVFLAKLSESPAFLPENEDAALVALRSAVREKLESNEEDWIVSRFQGISDRNRRANLVKRLQELLSAN